MKTYFEIEPAYASALKAAGLDHFDALMSARGGPPASRHRHRETVPLEIAVDGAPRHFFLKRVFRVPPRHAILPLLRLQSNPSQPVHEWNVLNELNTRRAALGDVAMRRVAVGERRRLGVPVSAFLLVEAVSSDWTLENWLVPGFPRPATGVLRIGRLLHELGALVGSLHASGVGWPDLQAKHVYAEPTGRLMRGREWRFQIIDVERMEFGCRPASSRSGRIVLGMDGLRDLLTLVDSMRPMSRDWRGLYRFLAGYQSGFTGTSARPSRFKLTHPDRRMAQGLCPVRPRLPDGFVHPRFDALHVSGDIRVTDEGRSVLDALGIHSLDDAFAFRDGASLDKPGLDAHRDRIRLIVRTLPDPRVVYMKRYRQPPWPEQLRRTMESARDHSTAYREVARLRSLATLGIPTPRPIAYGEEMAGTHEMRSFVVIEGIDGESLERLADRATRNPCAVPSFSDRREIILQLACAIRLMHAEGFFHRDLYLAHVFLTRNADNEVVLYLIDLARMLKEPRVRHRWAVKDLAALEYSAPYPLVTRADRVRFMYRYAFDYDFPPDRPWSGPATVGVDSRKNRHARARRLMAAIRRRAARMDRHDRRKSAQLPIDRSAGKTETKPK